MARVVLIGTSERLSAVLSSTLCCHTPPPDESAARLEEVGGALSASRHEALVLRSQNEELRDQNELLRHHCEELRELVTRAGLAAVRPAQPVPGSAQWLVSS